MKPSTGYYQHPYGGVAHDIVVKRERFARLFDLNEERLGDELGKVASRLLWNGRLHECVGSVRRGPRGGLQFVTTYIEYQ